MTSGASEMIFVNCRSRSSRATGPKMRVPTGFSSGLIRTTALRSKRMYDPSRRRTSLTVRTTTARATSPFFTVPSGVASLMATMTVSPSEAYRLLAPPITRMHWTFLAPELSATSSIERGWIIARTRGSEPCGSASASPSTAAGSPRSAPGHPPGSRWSRRAPSASSTPGRPAGSADDGTLARSARPASSASRRTRPPLHDSSAHPRDTPFFSRSTVLARARSFFAWLSREGFLATPIESWNLRLKISSVSSRAFCWSSSWENSRHFAAFIVQSPGSEGLASSEAPPRLALPLESPRARHEFGRDADLLGRRPERFAGHVLGHADHLVQDPPRLHHGDPLLRVALPLAHPGLRRLLRDRLVRKDTDPDLTTALETPGERHARGLDLAIGHPPGLEGLEAEVAEGEGRAAHGDPLHPAALGLPVLHPFGHQHGSGILSGFRRPGAKHLALEDPDLDADRAVGRVRRRHSVIDVRPDRVQWHPPVAVPLAPRDLTAAQPPGARDPDAVGAQAQCRGHGLLHRPPERDALLELERDVLGDELRVELRVDDLLDVEVDLLPGPRLQLVLELLDLGALPADDDARTRRRDRDPRAVGRALDVDLRDARVVELILDEAPDLHVFVQERRVGLGREPARAPGPRRAEPEADRMCFLAHRLLFLLRLPCGPRGRFISAARRGAARGRPPGGSRTLLARRRRTRAGRRRRRGRRDGAVRLVADADRQVARPVL